jgi:hypothetical protein
VLVGGGGLVMLCIANKTTETKGMNKEKKNRAQIKGSYFVIFCLLTYSALVSFFN